MKTEMTIGEAITRADTLNKMGGLKLPVKLSYAVSRNYDVLNKERVKYEQERVKLCEDACKKDESGKPIKRKITTGTRDDTKVIEVYDISGEDSFSIEEALQELREVTVELDIMKVGMDEIQKMDEGGKYDTLTVAQVSGIFFMLAD